MTTAVEGSPQQRGTLPQANSIVSTRANHIEELLGAYPEDFRNQSM
jgi:hypothetical protein